MSKGELVRKLDRAAWALASSPDGKLVATCAENPGTISFWDPATGQEVHTIKGIGNYVVRSMAFSPDSKLVVAAGDSHAIRLWDVGTGKEVSPAPGHHRAVLDLAFAPDGKTLASCGLDWACASGMSKRKRNGIG